jgi:arylsulfatase A-like enzyme
MQLGRARGSKSWTSSKPVKLDLGMMGGSTPNIDRIANDGMIFMDHYAQASCTAGRAAFITGQYPLRTGLSTVGLPGAKEGIQESDPTLATMLKAKGYATGQFGKNHLGDRDEHLPTNHGLDEFYGILYHLNAGEYPEQYDFPKDEEVPKNLKLKQRGVIHSKALPDGSQQIEDLGPWGRERQRNLDQEVLVGQVGPKMAEFVQSFQEFPPSQKSMSIQLDDVSSLINSQSIGR